MTDVYDHYRADGNALPEGVYRVVGIDEETVTLLALTDGSGRRTHSGRVLQVDRATLASLEPASNPDDGFRLSEVLDPFRALVEMVRYR
jgi:hypothetical protein